MADGPFKPKQSAAKTGEVDLRVGAQNSEPLWGNDKKDGTPSQTQAKKVKPSDKYTLSQFEASQIKNVDNFVD